MASVNQPSDAKARLVWLVRQLTEHPPSTTPDPQRLAALEALDHILMDGRATSQYGAFDVGGKNRSPAANPIKEVYEQQMFKALQDITTTRITSGVRVWQLYNMGYVVKTPKVTIGFDVVRGLRWHDWGWDVRSELVEGLAHCLDLLLVSHYVDNYHNHPAETWRHVDHYDEAIAELMLSGGKPVFIPTGHEAWFDHDPRFTYAGHHQSYDVRGLHITSYGGRHLYQDNPFDTPQMLYEVITSEGKKLFFTGDFDYTSGESFPYKDDIDILVLHTGGISPLYDDHNPHDLGDDDDAFMLGLQRFKTKFVVAGHLAELSHPPGGGRESYQMAADIFRQLLHQGRGRFVVMFWGEQFHFPV